MSLGFTNSWFHVNSASGLSADELERESVRVPLDQIASEARVQGVNVMPETVAGTLVIGSVAIRQRIEQRGEYEKRQANRIMAKWCVVDSAPLTITGLPAYTDEQLATLLAVHDAQACRNKVRKKTAPSPTATDSTDGGGLP
jgi:hypothetical protein